MADADQGDGPVRLIECRPDRGQIWVVGVAYGADPDRRDDLLRGRKPDPVVAGVPGPSERPGSAGTNDVSSSGWTSTVSRSSGSRPSRVAWDDVREVVVHPSPRSARAAAGWWGTSSPMDVMSHDDIRIPLTIVTWNRGCVKAARRAVIAHGRQRGIPVTHPASPPSPDA